MIICNIISYTKIEKKVKDILIHTTSEQNVVTHEWDEEHGYIIFCLCMGKFCLFVLMVYVINYIKHIWKHVVYII